MASSYSSTGDATPLTPAPPQSNPEVVIPREPTRYEGIARSYFIISMFDFLLGILFICAQTEPGVGGVFYLFLFMGVWFFVSYTLIITRANALRCEAEDAKLPMTLHPDGSTLDQEARHEPNGLLKYGLRGTVDSERMRLLPFQRPPKSPVNVPEVLYVQLHRAPGTEQPIAKIIYYHDTGPDGPSEKFLRRSLLIMSAILWLFMMWVFYEVEDWSGIRRFITCIGTTLISWGGWVRLHEWLDQLPIWYEIRQVEGPEWVRNTLAYGATMASCGHCGQKLENRLDNNAGQVIPEEGETIEMIV